MKLADFDVAIRAAAIGADHLASGHEYVWIANHAMFDKPWVPRLDLLAKYDPGLEVCQGPFLIFDAERDSLFPRGIRDATRIPIGGVAVLDAIARDAVIEVVIDGSALRLSMSRWIVVSDHASTELDAFRFAHKTSVGWETFSKACSHRSS